MSIAFVDSPETLRTLRAKTIDQTRAPASTPAKLVAAYIFLMPLIAGFPRDQIVPFMRLSEVVQVGATGAALLCAVAAYRIGGRWSFVPRPVDWCMFAVGVFGSIVPVMSLMARGESFDQLAILGAFPLAKYLGLYLLVRLAVKTSADIRAVLLAALGGACIVALLAIPEGLGIGPTGEMTSRLVQPDESPVPDGRARTLLGSPISTGAVLAICSSIAFGFAIVRRQLFWLMVTGLLFFGVFASGQISTYLAIGAVLGAAAWHYKVILRSILIGLPLAIVAGIVMLPVLQARLADSAAGSIVPRSWRIRWVNVTEIYWPSIADGGWILGVSPNTILEPPDLWRDEVFLESGYLWMLWVGGLPLLVAFVALLITAWRTLSVETTEPIHEIARVSARALIVFMAVFNIIDPHLTLRGGADLFYVLLPSALAFAPISVPETRRRDLFGLVRSRDAQPLSPTARIQIGEIGGPLLSPSGWSTMSPGHGVDRGFDIQVRDRGETIGEARVYFDIDHHRLDGLMFHPVHATDDRAAALVWRAIALCAGSLQMRSLLVPPGTSGLAELDRRELAELARDAERLERDRAARGRPHDETEADRQAAETPVGVRLEPHDGISFVRRAIDIAAAGGFLMAFAPAWLVIAALVRRSSPGPVLFRQMRLGKGGRPFRMLKFRTMDNSAGDDIHRESIETSLSGGPVDEKIADDPRVTRVGRVLRAWSLDEVPQLVNVLRGQMTLVGPRPSMLWETSIFAPRTRRRLQMVPGIAGLWQSSGRGDLPIEEMLELDLDYAESASLLGDTKLLGKTAVAVVTKRGAR
ncbi:MAG: sugar transferase [Actinomycetota bacterium]